MPIGRFGGMSWDHLMGVEPVNGRDIFSRVVYGARISLLIAFLATLLSVVIGTTLGIVAGFFGGWVDTFISRLMDVFLAFPLLVFAIALAGVIPDQAFGLQGNTLRIALLIFIIGFFNWPYIGRIIRGQTLSLREREFVDAARSLGAAAPLHPASREMLPNLVAPILVYSTLLIPTNILFEAALSFLGVGVRPPTATWGGMLSDAVRLLHACRTSCSGPAWRSSSPSWPSTSSGTGCATRSTHEQPARRRPMKATPPHHKKGRHADENTRSGEPAAGRRGRSAALGLRPAAAAAVRQRPRGQRPTATPAFNAAIDKVVQPVRQEGRHASRSPTRVTGTRSTRARPTTATPGTSRGSTAARC